MIIEISDGNQSVRFEGIVSIKAIDTDLFPVDVSVDDLYKRIKGRELDNPLGLQRMIDLKIQFNEFWEKYKRKESKKAALSAWKKLTDADRKAVLENVSLFVLAHPDVKFRPLPASYLNGRRWEDELPAHIYKWVPTRMWAKPNTWEPSKVDHNDSITNMKHKITV